MIEHSRNSISLQEVLENRTELDILHHYLGIINIPCIINSPLRIDIHPSFGLYSLTGKRIYYIDFSTNDRGGIFDLFSKIWNLSYINTLLKINKEVKINKNIKYNYKTAILDSTMPFIKNKSSVKDLKCKVREWKDYDIKYWQSQGITKPWLKFGRVYPISHIIVVKENKTITVRADKYAYAYVENKDNVISLKIYQPFNKLHKWSNKHNSSVWDLWAQLPPTGNTLIITSSRKDALCIWENSGIPSCSLQAESYLPKEHVINQLKMRFKNIYVLYDNDFQSTVNHGRILGKTLSNKFNLCQIEIPIEYHSKDISDLAYNYDVNTVKKVILSLINKKKTIN